MAVTVSPIHAGRPGPHSCGYAVKKSFVPLPKDDDEKRCGQRFYSQAPYNHGFQFDVNHNISHQTRREQ